MQVQSSPKKTTKNKLVREKQQQFQILDIQNVTIEEPAAGIKSLSLVKRPRTRHCHILIAGGGLGGIAAAYTLLLKGMPVVLLEETDWLGGQMTSQGVSALDENFWIETTGATKFYQDLRERIREHYLKLGAQPGKARFEPDLDPGNCWVSRLAFEPKVAVAKIDELLAPYLKTGQLQVFLRHKIVSAKTKRHRITKLLACDLDKEVFVEFRPKFIIDATELGDLLPLAGIPYCAGAESFWQTREEHAPSQGNPDNVQDFTFPFIVELESEPQPVINAPSSYEYFKEKDKFTFAGYKMFASTEQAMPNNISQEQLPFWEYRRLIAKDNFPSSIFANDIAMINWESNDLRGENIIDQEPAVAARRLALAKELSLGFLHWLQKEAPRDDGNTGYPELKFRQDMLGTKDGLSKYPYIRESRRIKALYTVTEKDISASQNNGRRAALHKDAVGIGHYPVDIHGHNDIPGAAQETLPFQIPAFSLTQNTIWNFLPACKNIGVTHITNGAFRLHPIEWAIGEAAGTIAFHALTARKSPHRLLKNRSALTNIQKDLLNQGAPIFWFDDVPADHPYFVAIQLMAAAGFAEVQQDSLHYSPDEPITKGQAAHILYKLFSTEKNQETANTPDTFFYTWCIEKHLFPASQQITPDEVLTSNELRQIAKNRKYDLPKVTIQDELVHKGAFLHWIMPCVLTRKFGL